MNRLELISAIEKEGAGDTVRQLRLLRSNGGHITRSSGSVSELSNGLPYFYVEVTCHDGSQRGIPAYGDEAVALSKETVT
jgi:hypothetical protein